MRLKTENWKEQIQAEMKTSSIEPAPLFNTTTNSLLGESFDIPIMDNYDSEGTRQLRWEQLICHSENE